MNRLRELREAKKYTLDDNEKKTGINRGTYNNYESGKTSPKEPTWQALANFFNVSVPYLQGTDDKTVIKKISSEDLLQELIDRKVLEPIDVGLYKEFELKCKYKNRNKPISFDGVLLLHNDN